MGSGLSHTESGTANANIDTVWKTCFVPMKWESWDPDVKEMKNVSGGLGIDSTFTFVMNDGAEFQTRLVDVLDEKSHKALIFSTSLVCGLLELRGEIELTERSEVTEIQYNFSIGGCMACVASSNTRIEQEIVNGVKVGLANIIDMSEKANSMTSPDGVSINKIKG